MRGQADPVPGPVAEMLAVPGSLDHLSCQPVDTTPEAVIVGNSKIIADKRANSIIVLGNDEVTEKVFKVIAEIDVRAQDGPEIRRV